MGAPFFCSSSLFECSVSVVAECSVVLTDGAHFTLKIIDTAAPVRTQPKEQNDSLHFNRLQSTFHARMQIIILLVFQHFFRIRRCRAESKIDTGNKSWTSINFNLVKNSRRKGKSTMGDVCNPWITSSNIIRHHSAGCEPHTPNPFHYYYMFAETDADTRLNSIKCKIWCAAIRIMHDGPRDMHSNIRNCVLLIHTRHAHVYASMEQIIFLINANAGYLPKKSRSNITKLY